MARLQGKKDQKFLCEVHGCSTRLTRRSDVKRHAKTHLKGKALEDEQARCPVTEKGCKMATLQITNLRKHVEQLHADVKDLVCFDCRPEFRRFQDTEAMSNHIQVEHPPLQKKTRKSTQGSHTKKTPQDPIMPPVLGPSNDNSNIPPQSLTANFPLPPAAQPSRQLLVIFPDTVTIAGSSFPQDKLQIHCKPSSRRIEECRVSRSSTLPQPTASASAPVRRCHRAPQKPPAMQEEHCDGGLIGNRCQLPGSPLTSSSAGGGSGLSLGRFPLPPPPPTMTHLMPAAASHVVPSPSPSRQESALDIPFALSREKMRGSAKERPSPYSLRSRR